MAEASVGGEGGAPMWLFSFVDLAFLMLIAMVILANQNAGKLDLGEIVVPRIGDKAGEELGAGRGQVWQLRVHPPVELRDGSLAPPFELVLVGGATTDVPADVAVDGRIDRTKLLDRLAKLGAGIRGRPLLAPHEDSRSQDLLDAASMIEARWPSHQRVAVVERVDL